MALYKALRGTRENLPSTKTDGYVYFCTDDGSYWLDYKDANGILQRKQVDAGTVNGHTVEADVPADAVFTDTVIIVDSALSSTSTNTVQNKVVNTKFDEVQASIDSKVNAIDGKGLSTNDYTTEEKEKLSGIEEGAEVNVQSNWTTTSTTSDSYIKNKPNIRSGSGTGSVILNKSVDITSGGSTADGDYSVAEGLSTTASGMCSHAEGGYSQATGDRAHAEGYSTASAFAAHSEGNHTTASGKSSHSEGVYTIAQKAGQHVEGRYNVADTGRTFAGVEEYGSYAHIVGNGTSDSARSNAHTLDWDGNVWFAGDVYTGSTSGTDKDSGSKKLATEEYVDSSIPTKVSDLTNDSSFATTTYVDDKVAGLVDSAPETLDTLNELSAALGNDPNFATTVANQIGTKVNKVDGKGLSTNDYTTAEKNKLSGIASGAQVNSITGVKGSSETTYRTGNVSISKTNIGLGNVDNTSDKAKPISDATQSALDNKAALSHKHSAQDINQGTLSFENGGTGATDRINAIHNLMLLTGNSVPNADTPTEWAKFGDFKCYYNENTTVINKPTTYGTLIQIIPTDAATSPISLQQIWLTQLTSQIFIRSGNATGWNGDASLTGADAWKQIFGAYSTIPVENGGTGATTAADARTNLDAAARSHVHDAWDIRSGTLGIGYGGTGATTAANARKNLGIPEQKDYVVERGTSSSWYYEKWNSGKLELWRQTTSSNLGTTGQMNGWYYREYTIALPSNLLKSVQDVQCNCHWGTGVSFASGSADTANFKATYFSNQNGGAGTFWHKITGTWK